MQEIKGDGKATQEQAALLLSTMTLDDDQTEKLLLLASQVSLYYNTLVKCNSIEPYIALQLAQAFQSTMMRGGG